MSVRHSPDGFPGARSGQWRCGCLKNIGRTYSVSEEFLLWIQMRSLLGAESGMAMVLMKEEKGIGSLLNCRVFIKWAGNEKWIST